MHVTALLTRLHSDDQGVSPVIGVILMVAITVILAAVIAAFVLGIGPQETAPSAQFEFENSGGDVVITHTSGDKIQAQYLHVTGEIDGATITEDGQSWDQIGSFDADSDIGSGDSVTVSSSGDAGNGWDLRVTWEQDDQSNTLAQNTN